MTVKKKTNRGSPRNITKKFLITCVNATKRHKGNRSAAARELKIPMATFRRYVDELAPNEPYNLEVPDNIDPKLVHQAHGIPDDELHDAWKVFERYGYNESAAATAVGLKRNAFIDRIKKATYKFGYSKRHLGATHAAAAKKLNLPKKGSVKRYILTSAQNNTKLHDETWESLVNIANFYEADIKVATFTYIGGEGSEKRGHEKDLGRKVSDRWYDPRIMPWISDEFEQLAPGLVWCGHHNTLPTASEPLRGKDNLNGRSSGIFPHTRIEMRPVATAAGEATKFMWTTGAVTLRNYIQKNSGIVAEFYHCFGGLLVEVDSEGNWFVRQLNADSDGVIYDLDIWSDPDGVWQLQGGIPALVFGDIHEDSIDKEVEAATWGDGGLVDMLEPNLQVVHDLLNMNNSHHNRRDPHVMYMLMKRGKNIVWDELRGSGEFLDGIHREYEDGRVSEEIVVDSNHHRHFDRYLKEVDWRDDLQNARTILRMNDAWLDSIDAGAEEDFYPFEHALRAMGYGEHAKFMNLTSRDEDKLSRVVCPERGGGIEVGAHHGDRGPNGSKGTPKNLSKLGRKNVIGDKHAPGIYGGTYVAGMTGDQRQLYNFGPGGWAAAHVAVYPNGKRQVILIWKGMAHAPRP